MSTRDYRTRNEILVTIAPGERAAVDDPAKQKGPPPPPKTPKRFLPRRIQKGGVAFYDLGQINQAPASYTDIVRDWYDLDFVASDLAAGGAPGNFTVTATTVVGRFDTWFTTPLEFYHAKLRAKIFNVDPVNWKDTYRKLEFSEGYKYGVEVRDCWVNESPTRIYGIGLPGERKLLDATDLTAGDWTAGGLKLPGGGLAKWNIQSFQLFWHFDNNPANHRITNLPSYTAPIVTPPALTEDCEVFLMPMIVPMYWLSQPDTAVPLADALFAGFAAWQRRFWLGRTYPEAPFGILNYFRGQVFPNPDDDERDRWKFHIERAGGLARAFHYASGLVSTLGSAGLFPEDRKHALEINVDPFLTPPLRVNTTYGPTGFARGRLVGVIKKAGQFFYFWTGGTNPNPYPLIHYGHYLGARLGTV